MYHCRSYSKNAQKIYIWNSYFKHFHQSVSSNNILKQRLAIWDEEYEKWKNERVMSSSNQQIFVVKEPNLQETKFQIESGIDSVSTFAKSLNLQKKGVIARIRPMAAPATQSILWDLNRPLSELPWETEQEISVEILDFHTDDGARVFWHSSAHMLGHAIECHYGHDRVWLSDGPPLDPKMTPTKLVGPGSGGYFYDFQFANSNDVVTPDHYKAISKLMQRACKGSKAFERMEIDASTAKKLFENNPHKLNMIEKLHGRVLSAYRCGDFIDLCRGPHVPDTSLLGDAMKVLNASGTNDQQQRVYAIAFPTKDEMVDWENRTAEAKKRDHRVIGKAQELFMFHQVSPGSAFMLPHGTVIYNRLVTMLRDEYTRRGYDEVMTPLIYASELWQQSGHLQNYKEHMYQVVPHQCEGDHDHDIMGLKPMNCPGHCVLYAQSAKSFRELPVRLADFSALHRNEYSGSLGGMTRLRRFHQDDAHIFCLAGQIHGEVLDCINFVRSIYEDRFDFSFRMRLSTRPEKSIGTDEQWTQAETALQEVLTDTKLPWDMNPGDGAFYGPKIDISITDALGREHQCATVQLDFQLPERFDLSYMASDGSKQRPVMIHRAILGSLERFIAILTEHTGGKWPFWLSPRQIAVLPVTEAHKKYANEIAEKFRLCCVEENPEEGKHFLCNKTAGGLCVVVDDDAHETLAKRLRRAQQDRFNMIFIIGDEEINNNTVGVRTNDATIMKSMPLDELLEACALSVKSRRNKEYPIDH